MLGRSQLDQRHTPVPVEAFGAREDTRRASRAVLRGALHAVIAPLEALGFADTPADYLVGVHAAVQAINTHLAAAEDAAVWLMLFSSLIQCRVLNDFRVNSKKP